MQINRLEGRKFCSGTFGSTSKDQSALPCWILLCTTLLPNLNPISRQNTSYKHFFRSGRKTMWILIRWLHQTVFSKRINPGSAGQGLSFCMVNEVDSPPQIELVSDFSCTYALVSCNHCLSATYDSGDKEQGNATEFPPQQGSNLARFLTCIFSQVEFLATC